MPGDFIDIRDARFAKLIHGNARARQDLDRRPLGRRPGLLPGRQLPVWSDIPNDRLMRWDETGGTVSVFEQPCRNQNGHTVDREGRLLACEHRGRCVSRIEPDGSRAPSSPTATPASG